MKIIDILSLKGILFLLLFSAVVLFADQINFSEILGPKKAYFTFFQFVGPIAGGFLGAGVGALSVLLAQVISFIWLGKEIELVNILRLTPMLFATFYFAKYGKGKITQAVVPLICMALFIIHPIGSQAWYYCLYWLIPLIALLLPEHLFMRSLGATFTAHSIGSTVWLYFVPGTDAAFWLALIPVVAFERFLFALGISISFVAFTTVLSRVEAIAKSGMIVIDKRYVCTLPRL